VEGCLEDKDSGDVIALGNDWETCKKLLAK
jgi:hypothetical protein